MSALVIEIVIILRLLAANGLLAITEIAVVSRAKPGSGAWRKRAT